MSVKKLTKKEVLEQLQCIKRDTTKMADALENGTELPWEPNDVDNFACMADFAENAIEYIKGAKK